MSRVHFFEIADFKWFPQFLRNYLTDFLQFLSNKTKMYKPIIPILEKGLELCKTNQIIDLASGGGGGILWLNSELLKSKPDLKILLTDLYPNINAFNHTINKAKNIEFIHNSVDVKKVPKNLKGLRTQFLSFHHFRPKEAKLILQNAVDSKTGIAIFEAQERTIPSILAMIFSPISVLFTTPFIKPFKIGRILFTYIIPIVPLVTFWDGIVSSLRTYSVKEMTDLVNQLENKDDFYWDINKVKSGPGTILYLLGTPKS